MSHTTMYVIEPDGELSEFATYNNSHGSAAQVWTRLTFKHLANVADPDCDFEVGKRHWISDDDLLTELYDVVNACAAGKSDKMAEHEWRTALACADYVIIKPEDLETYAAAMELFGEEWRERCAGKAFSIPAQAVDLRRVAEVAEDEGYRGVCFRQTSVSDVWDYGEMTESRRRTMLEKTLRTRTSLDDSWIDDVAEILAEEWQPIDDCVPYNIDIDSRHSWLPG